MPRLATGKATNSLFPTLVVGHQLLPAILFIKIDVLDSFSQLQNWLIIFGEIGSSTVRLALSRQLDVIEQNAGCLAKLW